MLIKYPLYWLVYYNVLQIVLVYVLLERHLSKSSYLYLFVFVLVSGRLEMYAFLATLVIYWLGICLISLHHSRDIKKAVYISSLAIFLSMICDEIEGLIFDFTGLSYSFFISCLFYIVFAVLLTSLVFSWNRKVFYKNERLYLPVMSILVIGIAYFLLDYFSFYFSITVLAGVVLVGIMLLILFVFVVTLMIYRKVLLEKVKKEQAAQESQHLKAYLYEIEKYNAEVRKFRHDYQNILSSFQLYILNQDMEGLQNYFQKNIKHTSEIMDQNISMLSDLEKVRVFEIKSILANKLMQAQEKGILASFEATENIENIGEESFTLVRMLGIILDNAIEEVETLEKGEIRVAAFYKKSDLIFIFENTCRKDIEEIYKLMAEGYSTKGDGRGHGLGILKELSRKEESLHLETAINDHLFLQKIIIYKRE